MNLRILPQILRVYLNNKPSKTSSNTIDKIEKWRERRRWIYNMPKIQVYYASVVVCMGEVGCISPSLVAT